MTLYPRGLTSAVALILPIVACALLLTLGATAIAASGRTAASTPAAFAAGVPHPLSAAVASTASADRALVSDAHALESCQHAGQPSGCGSIRGEVQRAGRRLARAERHLGAVAQRTAGVRATKAGGGRQAPVLSVDGDSLTWTPNRHINTYVLLRTVPGEAPQYSVVHGTSTTPPAVPGVSVGYRIRTASNWSLWSERQSIAYPPPSPSPAPSPSPSPSPGGHSTPSPSPSEVARQAAPAVQVSGETLSWNRVDGVTTYVLVTKVPGQAEAFSVVVGTSITPAAVAGATVRYSVRTAVDGSLWAPEVSISYLSPFKKSGPPVGKTEPPVEKPHEEPPVKKAEEPPVEKHHEEPPVEKPHEEKPVNEPPAGDTNFQPGVVSGTEIHSGDLSAPVLLGAKLVRVPWSIDTPASQLEPVIAAYASKGIRVAPLAEFYATMPTPAEAQNLASWAKAFGPGGTYWAGRSDGALAISTIEFGNETASEGQYGNKPGEASYFARAQTYGVRFQEAAEAMNATGVHVGLLAQDEDETPDWMNGMYSDAPNLTKYVAGWTLHPYGGEQYNRERLDALIAQTAEHGASSIPIDLTEWGVATDNGRCLSWNEGLNRCMTYEEAAQELKSTLAWIGKLLGNRLGYFFIYQTGDQAVSGTTTNWQDYFGILQHGGATPKGAYTTAVEEMLAS